MEIVARLTSDAQVTETKTGKKVVNFTVAINEYYKPKNGEGVQLTTFIRCAYWISPQLSERLLKGALVQLSGRIGVEAYLSRTGDPVGVITCHVSSLKIHTKNAGYPLEPVRAEASAQAENQDDDLPF